MPALVTGVIAAVALAIVGSPTASANPGTTGTASSGAVSTTGAATSAPATVVDVDTTTTLGQVQTGVLGQAFLWSFGGMGSYDAAGQPYPSFVQQLSRVVQPGSLRWPGGITGEAYHWERAIGPQQSRTPNAYGPSQGPSQSTMGPDEFGALLDKTGAVGVVTADFATGTAAEAAAFVQYMTGAPGSSYWADQRVRNGHRAPYDVPYWEVGNEEYAFNYWRGGTVVTMGTPGEQVPASGCQQVTTCLYIYGGTTSFTDQPVVGYADRSAAAADSTGSAGQTVYAQYPPIVAGSQTVAVGGTEWRQVSSLSTASATDDVYTVDPTTGAINFGDGQHGAIPTAGAKITLSYQSGPHSGFLDFYRAMKAANPSIKICSSDNTSDFIQSMGSTLPYDCVQAHSYTSQSTAANDVPIAAYQDEMMAGADAEATGLAAKQAAIQQAAGHAIPLVETEYGQLLSSNPTGYPDYHESLDEALLNATQLANFIRLGLPIADRQLITAEIPPDSSCCTGLPQGAPYASTAAIGTPGPDTVLEATGELYDLFAPLADGTIDQTTTLNNPALPNAPTASALDTLAVQRSGRLDLLIINRSTTDVVSSRILLQGATANGTATTTTLNGATSLSYNTTSDPTAVALTHGRIRVAGSSLTLTAPAHSITLVQLPSHRTAASPLAVSLAADSGVAAPGGSATLTATVSNSSRRPVTARLDPIVPGGWSAAPAHWVVVPAGSSITTSLAVPVPADAAEAAYTLGLAAFGTSGEVDGLATSRLVVRDLGQWTAVVDDTFEGQSPGSPPAGFTLAGPAGSFTVQPSPSGSGQVLQVLRPKVSGAMLTADQSITAPTGSSRLLFDVWADQTDAALGIQLLDASGSPVLKLSLATAGDLAWTNGTTFQRGASYTTGQWYTIETDLDPATGSYKLYIDNVLTATTTLSTAAGPPVDIRVQMPSSPNTAGTFFLDNLEFDDAAG